MRKPGFHDLTFSERIAAGLSKRLQGIIYTSRGGLAKGLRRKGGLGFLPGIAHPETAETRFLQTLNFDGKTVYDIGGFQGIMTLFFAKTAAQVITFEANPANAARINENAQLNGFANVRVLNLAVGDREGLLSLCVDPSMTGTATGDPEIFEQIRHTVKGAQEFTVALTSIDSAIRRFELREPDFVKIDIEGMELDALQGMVSLIASRKPQLYLELHGTTEEDKRANAAGVIDFVRTQGYSVLDVEQDRDITTTVPTGRESHIYAC
jgi:FkbM family methyltransferase